MPSNFERFFYDYDHSQFIECNSEMVKQNLEYTNGTYRQNIFKNEKVKPCFAYLINQLESMYKRYWFSSGSLLGKYLSNLIYLILYQNKIKAGIGTAV